MPFSLPQSTCLPLEPTISGFPLRASNNLPGWRSSIAAIAADYAFGYEQLGGFQKAFEDCGGKIVQKIWAPLGTRVPDGICLDADGQVWVANALANEVFRVREGGDITEVVETSQPCFACMLGGDDGRTLFAITAESSVEEIASKQRTGKIETYRAPSPRAGRP